MDAFNYTLTLLTDSNQHHIGHYYILQKVTTANEHIAGRLFTATLTVTHLNPVYEHHNESTVWLVVAAGAMSN